jgi:hypothetical protein
MIGGAKLARHLCAIANHGGGYVVIGFDDKKLAPQPQPPNVEDLYHRDLISKVVVTYLHPPFLCDVAFQKSASGNVHPIIRIPSHGPVPVSAKANGPEIRKKIVGLEAGRIYIRKVSANGPASEPTTNPDDWPALIRRCVSAEREALQELLRMSRPVGLAETSPSGTQFGTPTVKVIHPGTLERWHSAARH